MRNAPKLLSLAIAGLATLAGNAAAEEPRSGVMVMAGGGIEEYVGKTMKDTSDVSGNWALRAAVDVQRFVALEAGYLGSASAINAPIGNDDATLLGSTFEALGRVTPTPEEPIQPYAFIGAGWRHFEVSGETFTTADSGMRDAADIFALPVGAGLLYRERGLLADVRFTYRYGVGDELVLESDGDYAPMTTWGFNAGIGYEF